MIQKIGPGTFATPHMMIRLEEPDVVFVRSVGTIDKQDMLDMHEVFDGNIRGWPNVLLVVDQSQQEGMTAEARKMVPEIGQWVPYRGTVMYGGSFAMRTVGQMLMKLINLVRQLDNPTAFLNDEQEARAWVERRRRELVVAAS